MRSHATEISLHGDDRPPRKDNLFAWTIAILLLAGFAIACWIFSFYVFGHPEEAFSYKILTKLKKLDPPKRFEITAAPRGEFLGPQELWDRYNRMTDRELKRTSEVLMRNYLRNYKLTQELVPYVVGSFMILDSNELRDDNLFTSGVAVIAQAKSMPYVLLEQAFTTDRKNVPAMHRMLLSGVDFDIRKIDELAALVNVKRLGDGRLLFTTVPILYGGYAPTDTPGTFSLEPPTRLNMAAGLPIATEDALQHADQKLASHRLKAGLPAQPGTTPKPQSQLVRVQRPEPVDETLAIPSPTPGASAPPVASSTPAASFPSPTPETPATPTPPPSITTTTGGSWPTYPPSQMPRGRLLNVVDTSELAGRSMAGERIYLQGNFIVTASGQNRAVLRSQAALPESLGIGGGKSGNTRVIVEFPVGSQLPSEGSTFSRDSRRPFLITEVRKTADGQINVYAREITKP